MAGGASSSFGGDEPGGMIVDINVTPLVDITLVLLIIFMVTATYIVNPSIKVDLPKASAAQPRFGKRVRPAASRAWSRLREGRGMGLTIRMTNNDVKPPRLLYFRCTQGSGFAGERYPLNLIRVMPA